jgi:hypothetical protein
MENRSLKLSQLEVSLILIEREISNRDWMAMHHVDPSQRAEARIEAESKRHEAEEIQQQIEKLRV